MRVAPLFKGATRPACIWGIPIKPFITVCGAGLLLSFWIAMPILFLVPVALFVMHQIAEKDDQAFRQMWIDWLTRKVGQKNRALWGAVASYAPADYAKPKPLSKQKAPAAKPK